MLKEVLGVWGPGTDCGGRGWKDVRMVAMQ